MGELPKARVQQSQPFKHVGLDFCGPFLIKEKKLRNKNKLKVYVAVFICFTTKAVHLELVTDLTTETCIEALKRFIARRDKPTNIYSDNATNFVTVNNELIKIRTFLNNNKNTEGISKYLENIGIDWHLSPPQAPQFNGLWEAAVKSFQRYLHKTIGDKLFTYKEFNTFVIEIESILNSRHFIPLSNNPNDLIVLTPSHLLLGDSRIDIPEHSYQDVVINRLFTWEHILKMKQHFWQRWNREYLHELRTRAKWHQDDTRKIEIGTLVTIQEDNLHPRHWKIGRIVSVHPGADNIVRVATVRTQEGTYKRAIKKLAPLSMPTEENVQCD